MCQSFQRHFYILRTDKRTEGRKEGELTNGRTDEQVDGGTGGRAEGRADGRKNQSSTHRDAETHLTNLNLSFFF